MAVFEKLKDGDLFAGRPVRILDDLEAAEAVALDSHPDGDALYGKPHLQKGSKEAREHMAAIRKQRGKPKTKETNDVQEIESKE